MRGAWGTQAFLEAFQGDNGSHQVMRMPLALHPSVETQSEQTSVNDSLFFINGFVHTGKGDSVEHIGKRLDSVVPKSRHQFEGVHI